MRGKPELLSPSDDALSFPAQDTLGTMTQARRIHIGLVAAISLAVVGLSACSTTAAQPISVESLLDKTGVTVLGEPFDYPLSANPEVTSSIVVMEPGAETGLHLHEAPMYAYVLEGEVSVTYLIDGGEKTNVYQAGEAIMEGLDTPHNGVNTGSDTLRILVVNIGSPELENTQKLD